MKWILVALVISAAGVCGGLVAAIICAASQMNWKHNENKDDCDP